jgi:protein-tyrosine phosphatase
MTALAWDGCLNVRDLGGLPTNDGRLTRLGRIVRADNVRFLSPAGWNALLEHNVRRIVDLRFERELARDEPVDPPVEVIHVSVLGDWEAEEVAARRAAMDSAGDLEAYLTDLYLGFLTDGRERFGAAAAAVADAPDDGAAVLHCVHGKDRTGLLAALILRLCDVAPEVVAEDYARSGPNLEPRLRPWVDAAATVEARRRRALVLPTPARAMMDVLDELDTRHGGAKGFLGAAGLDEATLGRLRARLV